MKVPEPRRLPSGNYNVHLRLGDESISITRATAAECKQEAQLIKAEYLAGRRQAVSKDVKELTLSEAEKRFINAHKAVLSPSTVRSYESYNKHRFTGYLDKALKDIDFQAMINDELADASEKTVKNGWGLVRASLQLVGYPVPKVKLAAVPEKDLAFLQPEEIAPFCDAIRGKSYEAAALLLLHGLRLSEVLGLDWQRVDLSKGVIHVRGAVVRGPDGLTAKKTNKNKSSSRTVPIMIPRLSEVLRAAKQDSGAVVNIHPSNLLEDIRRASRRAGVTEVTCHDLRRSFLSLGYHLGISERQMMQWGGYSDIRTMHAVYIKLSASDSNEAKNKMLAFFSGQNANENANETKEASK